MYRSLPAVLSLSVVLAVCSFARADDKKPAPPLWLDSALATEQNADFRLIGEYATAIDHKQSGQGVRVAGLGGGKFLVSTYMGGLPGAGWDGSDAFFETLDADGVKAKTGDGERLMRIVRESPTLGKEAPADAVVLFAGEANDLIKGEIKDGLLWAGSETTGEYGDFHLHAEFRLPYKPETPLSSQDRGNSGLYLQNRYEVQVLDTFGLVYDAEQLKEFLELKSDPKQWCGCLYKFKVADVPMGYPALAWQTYDIDFTAPKFAADGKKTSNARVTVVHNGVKIHDDVELPKGTGAGGTREEVARGPIVFQGHGNPTAFRNVWLIEK